MPLTQSNGYITSGNNCLYASLFLPELRAKTGVVIFDAFGEEKKCAFRLMVRLARACSERGFAVLRFDLSGCGESSGEPARTCWDDWTRDADSAVSFLQSQEGVEEWVAVGARLGGLLAARTASVKQAAGLCLVEPILAGEDCLRDLERRQKIKHMMTGGDLSVEPAVLWKRGDTVDFGGVEMSAQLAEGLRAQRLQDTLSTLTETCRTHLIRVSGSSAFPAAWKGLIQHVDSAEIVKDKPFWGQLEYYESDHVIEAVLAALKGGVADADIAREGTAE